MVFRSDLLLEAVISASCSAASTPPSASGCRSSFGLLDVPHVAHPAFLVLGAYRTYMLAG